MEADLVVMPATAYPGDVVLVRARQEGELEWQGKTYPLQPFGTGFYTYIPIPIRTEPGSYELGEASLTVLAKAFDTQRLEVSEEQNSMRQNTERIAEDQKQIDAARASSEPVFLFAADSPFLLPVEGRLTTPFGFTRYVNGAYAGSHTAIDLAAPEGTPVVATQSGIVGLAADFYLTGNTIYIDHGMGLFSQYAHLSELLVETGDEVEAGQVIGLVGSTGFSTGPHLHFTFWAHNVPVNPNLFLDQLPFHWMEPGEPE
ncbi:M23 family peptidase [Xylanibacillus composti]|nr:M23 family peptidase [Xylanibacillus composti]